MYSACNAIPYAVPFVSTSEFVLELQTCLILQDHNIANVYSTAMLDTHASCCACWYAWSAIMFLGDEHSSLGWLSSVIEAASLEAKQLKSVHDS